MSNRKPNFQINQLFVNRWSARAMSGEGINDMQLMSLFEAARWAPSSYNSQPWRFIYAKRDTVYWNQFLDLLVPFNQDWAHKAAVLIVVASLKKFFFNNKPARTHSFDTGAACENMALQAFMSNLVCHGMEGFDYEKAHKLLKLPDDYMIEASFAIGKAGKKEDLPANLQEREFPSDRISINEFVFEGEFDASKKLSNGKSIFL